MTTAEATHVHHWLMASPCGPITPAQCKTCGEERNFPASLEGQYDPALMASLKRSSEAGVKARKSKTFNASPINTGEKNRHVFETQTRVAPDGKKRELALTSLQQKTLQYVKEHEGTWASEVGAHFGVETDTARGRLDRLADIGKLDRRVAKNKTVSYHVLDNTAAPDSPPSASISSDLLTPDGAEVISEGVGVVPD